MNTTSTTNPPITACFKAGITILFSIVTPPKDNASYILLALHTYNVQLEFIY